VVLNSGRKLPYDKLLLATGSETNFPPLPGHELQGVHGFYDLKDLANIEKTTTHCKEAVIIGAGLIGIELAEMLHSRHIKTTILNRHDRYWGNNLPEPEARLVERTLQENGIGYRLKTEMAILESDANGNVTAVITSSGEKIPSSLVCMATGVIPNTKLAKAAGLETARGILVNALLETSAPDVYAAGDCAELTFAGNQVEQLWYTGRLQGETVAYNICGRQVVYNRGIPFNSAKFFEVEFQSYGLVNPETTPGTDSFYWQHPEKKISLRINYVKQKNHEVCGLVALGMRLRQNICESWIRNATTLSEVLESLEEAFFDEEFSPAFGKMIRKQWHEQNPELKIKTPARRIFSWF